MKISILENLILFCTLTGVFILTGATEPEYCDIQFDKLTDSQIEILQQCVTDAECRYIAESYNIQEDCLD